MESAAIYMLSVIALILLLLYRQSEKKRQKVQPAVPERPSGTVDIVGKTTTVFLEPIPKTADGQPFHSQPLEKEEKTVVTVPDIAPDEIEANLQPPGLPDLELPEAPQVDEDDDGPSEELSQGLTFEQISHAVDVVENRATSLDDEFKAGETLTGMPADMLEFITRQENNLARVTALMAGYKASTRKQQTKPVKEFDISDFV